MFILDPALLNTAGNLRESLLFGHLAELDRSLRDLGGCLRIERGAPSETIIALTHELDAGSVFFNRDTTPYARRRDDAVIAALGERAVTDWGTLVHPPGTVLTQAGTVSQVFTPFYRRWAERDLPLMTSVLSGRSAVVLNNPGQGIPASTVASPEAPGEKAASDRLDAFDDIADEYLDRRDYPAIVGTSTLSADLRFGTLSPTAVAARIGIHTPGRLGFVRQLAWRDWYAHLFWFQPHLRTSPMNTTRAEIEWRIDPEEFTAWAEGLTGFPIIDAGMRELRHTGRMHNRVRMLTASFLVKDLLIDWRLGERWFRRQLIDGDVTQNVGNWQWAAGTGPDSSPYFRVFNPTVQSQRFDGDGDYIRRWVPELAGLNAAQIHEPSMVGPIELAAAGVILGDTYPAPIVEHRIARERALAAYQETRTAP